MTRLHHNPTKKGWIFYATHPRRRTFRPPLEYRVLRPANSEEDFPYDTHGYTYHSFTLTAGLYAEEWRNLTGAFKRLLAEGAAP
jgi:hypothetical protein